MSLAHVRYVQVQSIQEAIDAYQHFSQEGKNPMYYNGGTEIITMSRIHALYHDVEALIDIKGIEACKVYGFQGDQLVIGGSVTLAALENHHAFPLLAKNCSRIADHTSREKITLAGNICGNIQYKEAILPLLLTDASVIVADDTGITTKSIHDLYDKKIRLKEGAFIVQVCIDKNLLDTPFISKKMTKIGRIGYPVVTVNGIRVADQLRFAFSGVCAYPFRSNTIERILNNVAQPVEEKMQTMIKKIPAPILDDHHATSAYRIFVLENLLNKSLQAMKEA